jgi:hypothetical protein
VRRTLAALTAPTGETFVFVYIGKKEEQTVIVVTRSGIARRFNVGSLKDARRQTRTMVRELRTKWGQR